MSEYDKNFRELGRLFGGFFHQDWKEVIDWQGKPPTYEGVVGFYKTLAAPSTVAKATQELRQFLTSQLTEEELDDILSHDFGAAYYPPGGGQTHRQWLTDILRLLEEPAAPSKLRFTR